MGKKGTKKDKKFLEWISEQKLYGNYRDLQKIAIYYKTFLDFNDDLKCLLSEKNAFDFAKKEFEKYNWTKQVEEREFYEDKTAEEMIGDFKKRLAEWAIQKFNGAPKAESHFKNLGGETTRGTLYNWKNQE